MIRFNSDNIEGITVIYYSFSFYQNILFIPILILCCGLIEKYSSTMKSKKDCMCGMPWESDRIMKNFNELVHF